MTSFFLSFDEAKQKLLSEAKAKALTQTETVPLFEAQGRVLAETIFSPLNVPAFNQSAMDGYGIRMEDLSAEDQQQLLVDGALFAGDQKVQAGTKQNAIRVMTGAALPENIDCVIMQEQVTKQGDSILFKRDGLKKGLNIRYVGENVQKDAPLLSKNERLTLPKLTTLASLGISQVLVYRALKVAIFSTGNELTSVGEPLKHDHMIYDTNRFMLKQFLTDLHCEVMDLGILKDDIEIIKSAFTKASQEADLIITSGGVSVGDADFTKQAMQESGEVEFWKIAMKPGKPFAFGKIGNALFCGLPGNPVSAMITFYQLVKPMIFKWQHNELQETIIQAKTISFLKKKAGRMDFQRGILSYDAAGAAQVATTGKQESHLTTSFHDANCFILLEQDRGDVEAGEMVNVQLFDATLL